MISKKTSKCIALLLAIIIVGLTQACDNDSTIISASDMEDILYDYHVADAMANEADGGYDKNVIKFRAAVLKKYNVSQEKFDTSMVYYMRHTDELYDIYKRVSDRMQDEANKLGADATGAVTAAGDSANVWKGEKSMILIPYQPFNLYDFRLKTDTTFHKGDRLILSFKTDFIFQDGMRDGLAMLAIVLGNDSVASRVSHLSSSMTTNLQIDDNDSLGIKEIRGFFLLTKNNDMQASTTTLQLMSLHDIQLIRVHPSKAANAGTNNFGPNPPSSQPMPQRVPIQEMKPDSEGLKPQPMQ